MILSISSGILLGVLVGFALEILRKRFVVKYINTLEEKRTDRLEKHRKGWARVHAILDEIVRISQHNLTQTIQNRINIERSLSSPIMHVTQKKLKSAKNDIYILKKIPGIGKVLANKLLKDFGSIDGIRKASVEALTKIDRVNVSLANKIKAYLE
jgi:DNA integrity scanning protein DisA with diadenylate cyclase activity